MHGLTTKFPGLAVMALSSGLLDAAALSPALSPALASSIAPLDQALTLAQIESPAGLHTILVLENAPVPEKAGVLKNDAMPDADYGVLGLNLSKLYGSNPDDPLTLVASLGQARIRQDLAMSRALLEHYERDDFVISPAIGSAHVAAGTNYSAHGEEVGVDEVFLFPKFSDPTPQVTRVTAPPGGLLDYEIELCARFDRDITSLQDFNAAVVGVFLCGDYTDRATLMREIDTDDVASGRGFTDAKSGNDRFPVGPFTVVPDDWEEFLNGIRMTLSVNGEIRQQASGADMIMKLDEIVLGSLKQGGELRWTRGGERIRLIEDGRIRAGQVVLTGTPEGVVFRQPTRGFIFWNGIRWLFTFGFLGGNPLDYVIERFIEAARDEGKFLQPGDAVVMQASYLGEIKLTVTE